MTMHKKIFLLVVILAVIVLQSTAFESYSGKGSSALDKREKAEKSKANADDTDDHDSTDDEYSETLSARRNRYPGYGPSSNNQRSRSRWSSSNDDSFDFNDRSRHNSYGKGGRMSKYPGYSSSTRNNEESTCFPLLDPQYTIFSEICGVIPQARYSLPNYFGHVERWQIAQALTVLLGPSTPSANDPPCTRSLKLLVCPLLFPPCQSRRETPPVLPCQSFCRAVKNQCTSPAFDLLPCDFLPTSSVLCPTTALPYNSMLSSFGSPFSVGGSFPPSGLPSPSLSSLISQSSLSPGGLSPFLSQPNLNPSHFPSNGLSSASFGGSGMSSPPMNRFNAAKYAADSLSPVLVDFPPLPMGNDMRKNGRFF